MTDDKLIEAMARAVCSQHLSGYCKHVGGGDGCKVGRGVSGPEHCKMTSQALPWTVEYNIAQAALAAHAQWMKAEGLVCVPEVPTEAMVQAGYDRLDFYDSLTGSAEKFNRARPLAIYTAMIAAAKGEA